MRDLIGRTLGHYRVVEHLGGGGMGVVYRAEDTKLGREVALKFLPPEWSRDPAARERFLREARAASALEDSRICTVHDIDETEDGQLFIAMAFYEGETLKKRLERGRLPIGTAIDIAIQVAEGLERAHSADIIHRDIKPANLMLTRRDEVVIVDFGLAKLAGELSLTKSGSSLGTPHYMSPEQASGGRVDGRADLWSLGIVLFEMLGGQRPFVGENNTAVARAILDDEPPTLTDLRPEAPSELGAIVAKALEKDAAKRYQSAGEFLGDLKGLQEQLSVGEGLTEATPLRAPAHRRPYLAPMLVAAVLFVATTAVIWFLRSGVVEEPVDTAPPRIVVLPFENLGSPDDEYFASGITEEITSRLAAVSGMQVISRTSARRYADTDKSIGEIGEELNVGYVLEGTIRWDRGGTGYGRVRITPQLIRVVDDSHLWSERYDRVLEDIFAVQSNIAEQVIDRLEATILEPERQAVEARPTENMEAYQAYLVGLQYWWTGEDENTARMMLEMLKRAVKLDPDFALAHALLSQAHSQYYHFKYDFTDARRLEALEAAERALDLRPELAEAHLALGWYYYWCHRDYEAALAEIAEAEKGRPNDPDVLTVKWAIFRRMGRWQEALATLGLALEIDPRGYLTTYECGATLTAMRQYERAEGYVTRAIEIAPDRPDAYSYAVLNSILWDGETEKARRLLLGAPTLDDPRLQYSSLLLDYYDRDFDALLAGIAELQNDVLALEDAYLPKELLRCVALDAAGDGENASAACESAVSVLTEEIDRRPYDYRLHTSLGHAYARLGRAEYALAAGERGVEMWPLSKDAFEGARPAIEFAKISARVGDRGRAIDQLEDLLSIPCRLSVPLLRLDPVWDPLRDHPRFQALLEEYEVE